MSVLEEIVRRRRERLAEEQRRLPRPELEARLRDLEDRPREFAAQLRGPTVQVIAEIKRRSPSAGPLAEQADPCALALDYAGHGAAALSVLTEQDYFGGEPHFLRRARSQVPMPVLRKDFLLEEYQIYESRLLRADAILLIVRLLGDGELRAFLALARALGMETLVEAHDAEELARALEAGAQVVGINNRNLETMQVDLGTTAALAREVPGGRRLVSESGIGGAEDVERLAAAGVDAVLVGTHLMRDPAPGLALRRLVGVPAQAGQRADY